MQESEKTTIFEKLHTTIDRIINIKHEKFNFSKIFKRFKINVNLGLQTDSDDYYWITLAFNNGIYKLEPNKLSNYDLELIATPDDLYLGWS